MQQNNEFIRRSIISSSEVKLEKLSANKKDRVKANISKRINSNIKQCLNERGRFKDSTQGDKRHQYCIYENMLELLINIDRDINRFDL